MRDPFDLLDVPRNPWPEPEFIRERYRERARALHPDRNPEAADAFAALGAARDILLDPARRLRALAGEMASAPPAPDAELSTFAFQIAPILRQAAGLAGKAPTDRLRAALLETARADTIRKLDEAADRITAIQAALEKKTRALDLTSAAPAELLALADRWAFSTRLSEQIRVAKFRTKRTD